MSANIDVELLDSGALTEAESAVFLHVCAGESDKQIARLLGISIRTVGAHIDHVYEKLHIKNAAINRRCTAVAMAIAQGMVRITRGGYV